MSASSTRALLTCAFKYYGQYILKYRDPVNGNLFFGSRFDDTLNHNYSQKKASDKDLPKDDLKDHFKENWEARKETVQVWGEEDPDKMREQGIKGVGVFHEDVMGNVHPEEVQTRLTQEFPDVGVTLTGYPDLVEKDGLIIDNKTSKRSKSEDGMKQELQPGFYSVLKDGATQDVTETRFDVLVRTKSPKTQQIKLDVSHEDRLALLKVVGNLIDDIKSRTERKNWPPEAFFRGGWECGYCAVSDLCRKTWGLNIPKKKYEAKPKVKEKKAWDEAVGQFEEAQAKILPKKSTFDSVQKVSHKVAENLAELEKVAKKQDASDPDEVHRNILI